MNPASTTKPARSSDETQAGVPGRKGGKGMM